MIIGMIVISGLHAQFTTTPKYRPANVSKGVILKKSSNQVVISDVPAYLWQHGCSPTSIGMIIGYYDGQGYSDLIVGDVTNQNNKVDNAIANNEHYNDYSLPMDNNSEIKADKSETGGAHVSNCIADFMHTSWSADNLKYGESRVNATDDGFIGYIRYQNNEYYSLASKVSWSSSAVTWNQFKYEIDNDRPVSITVDTDGDGDTDHMVAGIGYDDVNMLYGCYDTWDKDIHWFDWRRISSEYSWGVYCFTKMEIGYFIAAYSTNGGTITGDGRHDIGQMANLVATPKTYWEFLNWTESDSVVSTNPSYSFIVDGKRTLFANFEYIFFDINASSNPADGGYIRGAGKCEKEKPTSILAIANDGYEFVSWTENDSVVCDSIFYTFMVDGDRDLVANFAVSTSVSSLENDISFNIYPIPANEVLNIEVNNFGISDDEIKVVMYNSMGKVVKIKNATGSQGLIILNIADQIPGIYYVQISIDGKRFKMEKVLVLR